MNMKKSKWRLGFLGVLAWAGMAAGTEITLEQAETAVGNWIARGGAFGKLVGNAEVSGETFEDPDTGVRMHVVRIPGKGFAVTSADDGIEPIILFSEGDTDFIAEEGNPMWDLLRWDLEARAKALEEKKGQAKTTKRMASLLAVQDELRSPQEAWSDLLTPRKAEREMYARMPNHG
jgi:hypothetical protein